MSILQIMFCSEVSLLKASIVWETGFYQFNYLCLIIKKNPFISGINIIKTNEDFYAC
jgi:hypothetical protein